MSRRRPGAPSTPGAPKIVLTPTQELDLETYAAAGCTKEEVAARLGISADTIDRNFRHILENGIQRRNASLRARQLGLAMAGNPTMLIWLGKQCLGQSERHEVTGSAGGPIEAAIKVTFVTPPNKV